jgi:DNA-binding Lrp family transcriptional regulator
MTRIDLDETDFMIIKYILEDPKISHRAIARMINKSQPAVGARVKKYEKLGILQFQSGINFKIANIFMAIVNLKANDADYIMKMAEYCPFIVYAFKLSGKYNICVLLASTKIEKLYSIVNFHFRTNPDVKKISMDIISDFAKDFILPIDLNVETLTPSLQDGCGPSCDLCKSEKIMRYEEPSTK